LEVRRRSFYEEKTVELASQELIAKLLRDAVRATPIRCSRGLRMDLPQPERKTAQRLRLRCHCGKCRQCLDDARWDRIFNEKFADPDYYTRRHVRCSSPLESL
jgi:hypothetical protein